MEIDEIAIQSISKVKYARCHSTRRIVITGLGVVSPLGCGAKYVWNKLLKGESGITKLETTDFSSLPCKIAGIVPHGNAEGELSIKDKFSSSDLRSMTPAIVYALTAAQEALADANWFPSEKYDKERSGVAVGMGMVDLKDICDTADAFKKGYNKVSPFFVPRILPNMAAGHISIKYGFKGPNHTVSTACATGAHSIGDAYKFVQRGDADIMICGGAEAAVNPLAMAGFCRMRALSTSFNDRPTEASRPFDSDREGFVMGEGAAMMVLEEMEHAIKRGTHMYAEILGYGLSGDASHLTMPSEDGEGAILAMSNAVRDANINPSEVTYINAHATSTPIGDAIESKAIKYIFKESLSNLRVSSTKGAHGHLLGAAGNLESVFTVLACDNKKLPPTINLHNFSDEMALNYVANVYSEWNTTGRRIALKNAFGFGGTNASLCFAEIR